MTRRDRLHPNPLFRAVAVILLLVPCADLAVPGDCVEEFLDVTAAVGFGHGSQPPDTTDAMAPAERRRADGAPTAADPEGDCYCCCSHLVVGPVYGLPVARIGGDEMLPVTLPPRFVPPRACFHPPRLA